MTSCGSSVNCSGDSCSVEGRVGRARDGAGETGRDDGDGGDLSDGSGGEFE
jgi:hypothetical protein